MEFNKQQLEAINTINGNVQVIAAAGAGKSSTLIARIENMINNDIPTSEILAISFTNASATDLRTKLTEKGISGVACGTFHSICRYLLTELGYDNLMNFPNKYKYKRELEIKTNSKNLNIDDIMSWIGYQQAYGLLYYDETEEKESLYTDCELRKYYKIYDDFKKRTNTFDFGDWLIRTNKEYDDGNIKKKWKYVLVDECLPSGQYVKVENRNPMNISTIYNKYKNGEKIPKVLSYNSKKDIFEYKNVISANKSENRMVYELETEGLNRIQCTDNHKLLTQRGYVELKDIIVGKDLIFLDNIKKQKTKLLLNEDQLQIFLGSYLGDGYAQKMSDYETYRLSFTQGIKQKDYFLSKIKAFNLDYSLIKSGYTNKLSILKSNSTKVFALTDNVFELIKESISPLGLAIWYQDDGSYDGYGIKISSNAFTYEQNLVLQSTLKNKFSINCTIVKNKKYFELSMNKEDADNFLKIVSPYMHTSMQYKTNIDISKNTNEYNNNYLNHGANYVKSIKQIKKMDVYDIGVEDNHNFVTTRANTNSNGSGIVVHNCQDLNTIQHKLLDKFSLEDNIFAVGDIRQSIFQWNGAYPGLFRNFDKSHKDTKVINLYTNYRSCKNIVEAANHFVRPYFKDYENYKDAEAYNEKDGLIEYKNYETKESEAFCVVNKIEELIKDGVDLNEIAVLYRNNSMADYVENELKKRDIEYKIFSNSSFFERKEIKGIIAILRLICDCNDDEAFETVFKECRFYPTTFFKGELVDDLITESGKHSCSLCEALMDHHFEKTWEKRNADMFVDFINRLKIQNEKHLSNDKLINNIVKMFKINEWINEKFESSTIKDKLEGIENLKHISSNTNLEGFISYCSNGGNIKTKNKNGVSLMTCHHSKGLEYKVVFLISLESGKFPSNNATDESEARLMYVASTRAKEQFYLSCIGYSSFYDEYVEYFKDKSVDKN